MELTMNNVITATLKSHEKIEFTYDGTIALLQSQRDAYFPALKSKTNPITKPDALQEWTKEQLAYIIAEYSAFSNEAIHMLLDALIRDHDWPDLKTEILHNIQEELGEQTKDIPHLEMMRAGYRIDLGIETDHIVHSSVTKTFLRRMRNIFKHDDNAFSAGALLAFEGTAIAEFYILDDIVRAYKKAADDSLMSGSLTNLYIDGHKYYEVGHEDGLVKAVKPYITKDNVDKMLKGYYSVLIAMSTWWEELALEAAYRLMKSELTINDTEVFNVQEVFKK